MHRPQYCAAAVAPLSRPYRPWEILCREIVLCIAFPLLKIDKRDTHSESAFHRASQRLKVAVTPIGVRQKDVIFSPFIPSIDVDQLAVRGIGDEMPRGTHKTFELVWGSVDGN